MHPPTVTHDPSTNGCDALEVLSHRRHLFATAYRMLGSGAEAEDAVQDTFLRWVRARPTDIESQAAYLHTILVRLCIDRLRCPWRRRIEPLGPGPRQLRTAGNPMDAASVSAAFGRMFERLSPSERVVYVLRDMFGYSFAEVAQITGKTEANCRQIFRRARQHAAAGPRSHSTADEHRDRLGAFLRACRAGDVEAVCDVSVCGARAA